MRTIYLVLFILGAVCFLAASFWDVLDSGAAGADGARFVGAHW